MISDLGVRSSELGARLAKGAVIAGFTALGIATVAAQQKPAEPNDPRIGLKPGLRDAGVAARGMELVSTRPRPGAEPSRHRDRRGGMPSASLAGCIAASGCRRPRHVVAWQMRVFSLHIHVAFTSLCE